MEISIDENCLHVIQLATDAEEGTGRNLFGEAGLLIDSLIIKGSVEGETFQLTFDAH